MPVEDVDADAKHQNDEGEVQLGRAHAQNKVGADALFN
jgi:hypothetical protein